MYKITMKHDWHEIVFAFQTVADAADFMSNALDHATEKITFMVDALEEGEENEPVSD